MDSYDFGTFLAQTIAVFLLFSCVYRKHIRRSRVFFLAVGLFIAGLLIIEIPGSMRTPGGLGGGVFSSGAAPPPPTIFDFLYRFGRWVMYASIPVFLLACSGTKRTFPQCSSCGYDLTGNNSGVCPECGGKLGQRD